VHIILADVRYEFDPETKDRFGESQLLWLEEKFKEHSDSDVTLIASGV
jgi:hypothetical protein